MDVPNGKNITYTDFDENPQNVEIQSLMEKIVIINCQVDKDGNAHITTKGDGATREIEEIKIQSDAKNMVIINSTTINGGRIEAKGDGASASVGTVTISD